MLDVSGTRALTGSCNAICMKKDSIGMISLSIWGNLAGRINDGCFIQAIRGVWMTKVSLFSITTPKWLRIHFLTVRWSMWSFMLIFWDKWCSMLFKHLTIIGHILVCWYIYESFPIDKFVMLLAILGLQEVAFMGGCIRKTNFTS